MKLKNPFYSRFSVPFYIGLGLWTVFYFLPFLILGEGSYIRVHDTLEGEMVWLHLMKKAGFMHTLSNDVHLENIMDGLPRNVLPSGYTLLTNLCNIFDIFYGYVLSQYIFKTIGFVSLYLFIKRFIRPRYLREKAIVIICLLWVTIQFFTPFGLSVIGVPILAYGLASLYKREESPRTYALFFLFPFFSSFVWSGIELILMLSLYIVYIFIKNRDNRIQKWLYAWFWFITGTILANLQMLNATFFMKHFKSHRLEYQLENKLPNFMDLVGEFFSYFFSTHYHISIFVSTLIFAVFLTSYYGVKKNKWAQRIIIVIIIISLWQAFYAYIEYFTQDFSFINSFRFNRFAFLLPFLWMILLVISVDILARRRVLRRAIPIIFFFQFCIFFIANDEFVHNYKKLLGTDNFPSFEEYMANNQYREISNLIPRDNNSRIISLGLSPTIAQYQDYPTLDGLFSIYSLDFKHEFRKIIARELDKNADIKEKFDHWGNRCYMYSAELGERDVQNLLSAHDKRKVYHLDVDTKQIKKLHGDYIFSACEIVNYRDLDLQLLKTVGTDADFWKIYIYKL